MSIPARLIVLCLVTCLPASSRADRPKASSPREKLVPAGISRALIITGLPGDDAHEEQFAAIVKEWRTWLTDSLGFSAPEVRVLFGKEPRNGTGKPAAKDAVEKEIAALKQALQPNDRLWVFFLGHANYDGEHAYLHLPGRDLSAEELGKLFGALACREQVFWVTTPASGWFLKALSAKGRIVVTATVADDEYNETEFPQALVTVSKRSRAQLDANHDGEVSILELYTQIVAEVNERFGKDKRVPTEHAQLDDNGDGIGTEQPSADKPGDGKKPADGALAAKTFLPLKRPG